MVLSVDAFSIGELLSARNSEGLTQFTALMQIDEPDPREWILGAVMAVINATF